MPLTALFVIAISLSMDAFAVSLCKGLCMKKINFRHAFIIAAAFGGFQALMPLIGWALGRQFEGYITPIDHWIACGLLALIGGKMLLDGLKGGYECVECKLKLDVKELLGLAVATSIDALAVGITFAFLSVSIGSSITLIGITTFILSLLGVVVGNKFGVKYKNKATILGGLVLILIGIRILLEHLNIV